MNYFAIYYNTILFVVLLSVLGIRPSLKRNQVVEVPPFLLCFFLLLFAVWCLGSEPFVIGSWSDRGCYAQGVVDAQNQGHFSAVSTGELAFSLYVYLSSFFVDPKGWFYLTAVIYVGSYILASWRLTREYAFVQFLSFIIAFQFYNYGENTIRAGFSAALMLMGISFCNKPRWMLLFFITAFLCHKSMMVPTAALAFAFKYPKTKAFIGLWFLCILVSYFGGISLQNYVADLTHDTRADYLTKGDVFYKSMFRWDFLAYSALPVFLGWFYIYKLNYRSEFYRWVYNAYLLTNSFWIMVIRAAYTDRFAYLSWFMFPVLLMYPLLSQQLYRECYVQCRNIIIVLLGQLSFTYYMFWAYNGRSIF